jgi:hypothetical protein
MGLDKEKQMTSSRLPYVVLVTKHHDGFSLWSSAEYERALDSILSASNPTPAEVCDTIQ